MCERRLCVTLSKTANQLLQFPVTGLLSVDHFFMRVFAIT